MATKVVIPHHLDYRATVAKLLDTIGPWGMGCYTRGLEDDDAQIIVEKGSNVHPTLTTERQLDLLSVLPGVQVCVWDLEVEQLNK